MTEAVRVFREKTHRFPPKSWYDTIEGEVGDKPEDLERWGQVVESWIGLGRNPMNVKYMLLHFRDGLIPDIGVWPNGNGNRRRYIEGEFAEYVQH